MLIQSLGQLIVNILPAIKTPNILIGRGHDVYMLLLQHTMPRINSLLHNIPVEIDRIKHQLESHLFIHYQLLILIEGPHHLRVPKISAKGTSNEIKSIYIYTAIYKILNLYYISPRVIFIMAAVAPSYKLGLYVAELFGGFDNFSCFLAEQYQ